MSTAKPPPSQPPLMDSPDASEIYASEVVGTGRIGNSVAVSLATHRWVVPEFGDDLKLARVVVARLVLSNDAALQLARRLAALAQPEPPRPAAPGRTITGRLPMAVRRPVPVATARERPAGAPARPVAPAQAATPAKPESAKKRKSPSRTARKTSKKSR